VSGRNQSDLLSGPGAAVLPKATPKLTQLIQLIRLGA
jgi:hypothetical protein